MVDDKEWVELTQHFIIHRDTIQVLLQHLSQLPVDFCQLGMSVLEAQLFQFYLVVPFPEIVHPCIVHDHLGVELKGEGVWWGLLANIAQCPIIPNLG